MRTIGWRAAVVALAAVALVAGACGSSDGTGGGDRDSEGRLRLPVGGTSAGASAGMSVEVARDDAASMIAPARPIEYRLAEGATAPVATATAYRLDPVDGDVASKVATALGVDEDEVEVDRSSWFYSGGDPDAPVSSGDVARECAADGKCEQLAPTTTVPGIPSAEEARTRARQILQRLGDGADGEFEVLGDDGVFRTVLYVPTIDGVRVPSLQTDITFGRDGRVEAAGGFLATAEKVGDYPLVGMDEAFDRFQNGFGGGVAAGVRTAQGRAETFAVEGAPNDGGGTSGSSGEAQSDPSTGGGAGGSAGSGQPEPGERVAPGCAPDEPCSVPRSPPTDEPTMTIEPQPTTPTVPLEPEIVEITGAELVLELVGGRCPDDPVYLVPAFELLPGPAATVPAVVDDALATGGADDAEAPAEPCPGEPEPDTPAGKPEPAPLPADDGREPANR